MSLDACESKRTQFGNSMQIIRMNASASQVPILGGAFQGEDRGYGSDYDIPNNDATPWNLYNRWLSAVQGTLPSEWGEVFPNIEVM